MGLEYWYLVIVNISTLICVFGGALLITLIINIVEEALDDRDKKRRHRRY